jgi:hypothetical protein
MVKKLTVGNTSFSLNVLLLNPNKYLPIMQPLFRASVFARKATEDDEKYLTRLFNVLYKKLNPTLVVTSDASGEDHIDLSTIDNNALSALGIEIVKKCPKRSKIIFKNSGHSYRMNTDEIKKLTAALKHDVKFERSNTRVKYSFGVELEFIGNRRLLSAFNEAMETLLGDNYVPELRYQKNNGKKWILGTDTSVHRSGRQSYDMCGYELTSPILDLNSGEDLETLHTVCNYIETIFGGEVNATCGTHIHMSFNLENGITATDDLIKHFARSYRKSESTLFDKLVPERRRENHAYYSKSVSVSHLFDRYRKLNFNNVKKDTSNMHLEFRQLDGTIDANKIIAWARLQRLFVEITMHTWKAEVEKETDKPVQIQLDDVIISSVLDESSKENLMKMCKLIA